MPEQSVTVDAGPFKRAGEHASMATFKIDTLKELRRDQLLILWRAHLDQDPPRLRKELIVPLLAYRLQEREHGGLSQAARRCLGELADEVDGRRRSLSPAGSACKAGTRLVRSWKGELHEVIVSERGFEYRGRRFTTLSVIAREITGTRWSGPVFFGLREKASR